MSKHKAILTIDLLINPVSFIHGLTERYAAYPASP